MHQNGSEDHHNLSITFSALTHQFGPKILHRAGENVGDEFWGRAMNRRTALRRSLSKISPVVRVGGKLFAVLLLGIWIGSFFCGTQNIPIHDLSLPPVNAALGAAVPLVMDQNHPEQNGELKRNCAELESMLSAAQERQTSGAAAAGYAELLAECKSLLSMQHTAALKVQNAPHGPAPPPKQPSRLSAPARIIPEKSAAVTQLEEQPAADSVELADLAGSSLRVGFVRTPTLPPGEHTADDGKLHIIADWEEIAAVTAKLHV